MQSVDNPVVTTTYAKDYETVAKVILDKDTRVVDFNNIEYYLKELDDALGEDFKAHKTYLQIHGRAENCRVAICREGHYIGS